MNNIKYNMKGYEKTILKIIMQIKYDIHEVGDNIS